MACQRIHARRESLGRAGLTTAVRSPLRTALRPDHRRWRPGETRTPSWSDAVTSEPERGGCGRRGSAQYQEFGENGSGRHFEVASERPSSPVSAKAHRLNPSCRSTCDCLGAWRCRARFWVTRSASARNGTSSRRSTSRLGRTGTSSRGRMAGRASSRTSARHPTTWLWTSCVLRPPVDWRRSPEATYPASGSYQPRSILGTSRSRRLGRGARPSWTASADGSRSARSAEQTTRSPRWASVHHRSAPSTPCWPIGRSRTPLPPSACRQVPASPRPCGPSWPGRAGPPAGRRPGRQVARAGR